MCRPTGGSSSQCSPTCRSLNHQTGRATSQFTVTQFSVGTFRYYHHSTGSSDSLPPSSVSRVWSVSGPVSVTVLPLRWSHWTLPELLYPHRWPSKEQTLGAAHGPSTNATSSTATRPSKPERTASNSNWWEVRNHYYYYLCFTQHCFRLTAVIPHLEVCELMWHWAVRLVPHVALSCTAGPEDGLIAVGKQQLHIQSTWTGSDEAVMCHFKTTPEKTPKLS